MKRLLAHTLFFVVSFLVLKIFFHINWFANLIVSIIFAFVATLFLSTNYLKIRKLQKQAESLGWVFVTLKKAGKFSDYVYVRRSILGEAIFATLSWKNENISVTGKVYKDFAEIERDWGNLEKITCQFEYDPRTPTRELVLESDKYINNIIEILQKSFSKNEEIANKYDHDIGQEMRQLFLDGFFHEKRPDNIAKIAIDSLKQESKDKIIKEIRKYRNSLFPLK